MPLNPFAIVDAFQTQSLPEKQAQQATNALSQIKTMEGLKDIQRQNTLRTIAQNNPDLNQVASQYQQQTGDVLGAQQVRNDANQNSLNFVNRQLTGIKYIQASARMVNKDNYPQWRQTMIQLGLGNAQNLPEQYDQTTMNRLTGISGGMNKVLRLGTPDGKTVDVGLDKLGNTVYQSQPYVKQSTRRNVQYGKPYRDDQGNLVQMGDNGRIVPAGSGAAKKQGTAGLIDTLMSHGVDEDRAIEIATSAKSNPEQTAAGLARSEFKAQTDAGVQPDDPKYQSLDALYSKWHGVIGARAKAPPAAGGGTPAPGNASQPSGMTKTKFGSVSVAGTGSKADPFQPGSQDEYDALPSGAMYLDPKDNQVYKKGDN